jgi:transaldolase
MSSIEQLHTVGQSIWIDNITRDLLDDGTIAHYITHFGVSGLTSNPSIFEKAVANSKAYDKALVSAVERGLSTEDAFFSVAIDDLRRAADLFAPIHEATDGIDGWVSLEVSPLLADNAQDTIGAAISLFARAERKNLYIKIPGTSAGIRAIEAVIAAGVPVNVTLLFSTEQYLEAAKAYYRGIERRIQEGLDPRVQSVASLFISRWDVAVNDRVPADLHNQLGICVGRSTYAAFRDLLASSWVAGLVAKGAPVQRLLFASTGMKDPSARDTLYVEALAAEDTVNTMPDNTLLAFADHGEVSAGLEPLQREAAERLAQIAEHIDLPELAERLLDEGKRSFISSWELLLNSVSTKVDTSS